ncbi:MAG: protein kinase [Endomicrobiaceae bacterium]|nr:protein kinase [Endomicrobiaceae bacterium]
MNTYKALKLQKELESQTLNGYKILELLNNGKSAAVFKAEKNDFVVALKIFDDEITEKFGHEIEIKRIQNEIALKNHNILNLVKIYEGDYVEIDSKKYYYIAMEFIDGMNLKQYICSDNICDQGFLLKVFQSLIETTEQLILEKKVVHRDIKPENIMIDKNGKIVLMDLGVLKFIGAQSFTDTEEEKEFVATLRYAPPELLYRNEEDSENGWRAINIYQIGATLYNLIMKKEIFHDMTPYTKLVIAIKDDIPKVSNQQYNYKLIKLIGDMLTKDWKQRLSLVTKQEINAVLSIKNIHDDSIEQTINDIQKIRTIHKPKVDEILALKRTKQELIANRDKFNANIENTISKILNDINNILKEQKMCSDFYESNAFHFWGDKNSTENITKNYLYEFSGSLEMGYPGNLYILITIFNNAHQYAEIHAYAFFKYYTQKDIIDNPIKIFSTINKMNRSALDEAPQNRILVIKGTITDLDEGFIQQIQKIILKIINKALALAVTTVNKSLDRQKKLELNGYSSYIVDDKIIIVDSSNFTIDK